VIRTIEGFHQDEIGDWVAELSCLHGQHVRHQPPFRVRPWVETEDGRRDHLGSEIDCPLCDRAELPDGLELARTAGPFDEGTLPPGLRRDHRVASRTWGRLRVLSGSVRFSMATDPPVAVTLTAGDVQAIPPEVAHAVQPGDACRVEVDFLVRPPASTRR
jgi:tellurite resistance-related uncharacterized protein